MLQLVYRYPNVFALELAEFFFVPYLFHKTIVKTNVGHSTYLATLLFSLSYEAKCSALNLCRILAIKRYSILTRDEEGKITRYLKARKESDTDL